jgi:protein transport protein SEC31
VPANAQLGLIAGGLVDGTVNLWNPAKIVGVAGGEEPSDGADGALVASLQKHTGAVRGPCPCAQQRALRQP